MENICYQFLKTLTVFSAEALKILLNESLTITLNIHNFISCLLVLNINNICRFG